ncbi:unnamed protein product [Medioppia subpectinata]|uniref:Uncharacterized protein n=1 Tax=Medioppia subpectinata TaxID=1979941 RepID=A0A7R9PW73_9ACAR|nr:unnamed protein product [Medioppia subpectinata]CAG2102589.1 unnamed protein product [Medioppia subpectinata]
MKIFGDDIIVNLVDCFKAQGLDAAMAGPFADDWKVCAENLAQAYWQVVSEPDNFAYAGRTDLADFLDLFSAKLGYMVINNLETVPDHSDAEQAYNDWVNDRRVAVIKMAKFLRNTLTGTPGADSGHHLPGFKVAITKSINIMAQTFRAITENNESRVKLCIGGWLDDFGDKIRQAIDHQISVIKNGADTLPAEYQYLEILLFAAILKMFRFVDHWVLFVTKPGERAEYCIEFHFNVCGHSTS